MSTPSGFDIRFSEIEDLPFLQKWFEDPLACEGFAFDPDEKDVVLKNWIGFSRYKASLTGMIHGMPCAIGTLFLMPYKKVSHHCSFSLIVDPAHRKQGIGASMVRNLQHLAKTRFRIKSVHAELYEPSELLSVLKKEGFEQFARQENYVKMGESRRARLLLERVFL